MIDIKPLQPEDMPALSDAIGRDTFHPGTWTVDDFTTKPDRPVTVDVIRDQNGPIAFTRYTKSLRICCVWNDDQDNSRNAKAILFGIKDAVEKARASGFSEILIQSDNPKLATFLTRIGMHESKGEFLLYV